MTDPNSYRLPEPSNPYAPPETDLVELRPVSTLPGSIDTSRPYDVGTVIASAYEAYKQQFGVSLGIFLGGLGLNYAVNFGNSLLIGPLFRGSSPLVEVVYQLASTFVVLVFQLWIALGQSLASLKIARGRSVEFSDLFQGGPYLVRYFLASVVYAAALFAILLVASVPIGLAVWLGRDNHPAIMIAAIAFSALAAAVLFAAATVRISQYSYVLIDRDCGAIDSLRISLDITRGRALPVFATLLISALIGIAGVFACFVGVLFTYPLTMIILATVYLALIGDRPVAGKPPRRDIEFLDDPV